jgi:chromosome segregation ATPase
MKSNLAAIILILACAGLGFVLWEQHQMNTDQTKTISGYSNNVTTLSSNLDQQTLKRTALEASLAAAQRKAASDLAAANAAIAQTAASLTNWQKSAIEFSNDNAALNAKLAQQLIARSSLETNLAFVTRKAGIELANANAEISATSDRLKQAQIDAKASADAIARANADIAEKDKKIHELEQQNADLDKQASDLRSSEAGLEARMQAAQKKLDANDGDRNLLMAELRRVQSQKEEMENKLSDLAFLKEHVRSLRDNLATDRRADWIRRGLYESIGEKGGERLISPELAGSPATNTSLDVELHQGGAVKVNSPVSTNTPAAAAPSTNAPAARPPAARLAPQVGI